ncbi:MAG TPA: hypothetical protein VN461_11925 [Vicinamibacteria bacterium]|jgi:uncharacterized membrane protein|nr:hypothetical protein [Vicinamibacteria bacterium]
MDKLTKPGRLAFAIAVGALGIQQLAYADFVPGPLIAPSWLPWRTFWAFISGFVLLAAGVGIVTTKYARRASSLLSMLLLVIVLLFHLPGPVAIFRDGVARTRAFEALAMCGATFFLAGGPTLTLGRLLFALPMAVFGVQHFMYATFVATLIPNWLPGHLFWTYLTGVAFIAASLSIVTGQKARLSASLLGLMFLLWFVLLHAPRVAEGLRNGNEWNSALVALALGGGAWLLAGTPATGASPFHPRVQSVE